MRDANGLQYFLIDHLGSTVAITDSNGTLTSQQRYLPFGGTRTNVTAPNSPGTDFGYTGQRQLDAGMGGLMDYKARFYSSALGRFIQPDTIIPDASNPQAWNRYSYVFNRPISLNDPSGHCPDCATGTMTLAGGLTLAGIGLGAILLAPEILAIAAGVAVVTLVVIAAIAISEKWKQNTANQKQAASLVTSSYTTGDNNLGPGYNYKPPKCSLLCRLGLGIGGVAFACISIFGEKCVGAASKQNPKTTPIPTPTQTSTQTPTPTSIPTLTPTQTSTSTQTPTSTSTSTPTQTLMPSSTHCPLPTEGYLRCIK